MKRPLLLIITVTVACAAHAQRTFSIPVPPPPPLEEDVLIVAQAGIAPGAPETPKARKALPAPGVAPAAVPLPPDEPGAPRGVSIWASPSPAKYGFSFGSSSSSSRRTLVIPKGEASPDMLADAEEDLNVMTLLLEQALDTRGEDEGKKALGIDILSSSSGIRNVLIEGHGAIFTLKTKTALLPPPTPKKEETKTKDTANSEWDDARRRLYGPSEIDREIKRAFEKVHTSFGSSEEYDETKVRRLKESLTDALKSASNIRALSGDQTVTVVVLSSSPVQEVRKLVSSSRYGADQRVYAKADRESSENRSGSRMMLQAKKSDIDAYAKGNLTADAFRDKVKIQIY